MGKLAETLRVPLTLCLLLAAAVSGIHAQTVRSTPPAGHLVLRAKGLIDPVGARVWNDVEIEIVHGRVMRVDTVRSAAVPEGAVLYDFGHRYLIPGLIDTHGHLFGGVTFRQTTIAHIPSFYLAAGVTSVLSPGSMDPEGDIALRNRINSGRLAGPRLFLAGEYLEMAPAAVRWMQPLSGPEEARRTIDHWAARGAACVKIYGSMVGETLAAAIDHAHAYGLQVHGDISAVSYREAIRAGIDHLHHGHLTMSESVEDLNLDDIDTWQQAMEGFDVHHPSVQEALRLAADAKVTLTPTAVASLPRLPDQDHFSEQARFFSPEAYEYLAAVYARPVSVWEGRDRISGRVREFIAEAHRQGVALTTGTDVIALTLLPGFSLWREMETFAEAGLTPMEVLRAATINGARAIGQSDLLGSVEVGKLADLVVLEENPLESISNVRRVHRVIKGGVVYDPEAILKPLEGVVR